MAVTELTIGKSGTGKSALVVYTLVREWLPYPHNVKVYTNLPLKLDAIAEYFVEHHPELVSKEITDKIELLSADDTASWMAEKSGPWEYFRDKPLQSSRVIIDEVHNYVHSKSSKEYVLKWRQWLGELRHQGCEFEAISQYETKIHPLIRHECGLKRILESFEDKRDKVFWIRYYDHMQLLSKMKGYWSSRIWVQEFKPAASGSATWEKCGQKTVPLIPMYYALYNSYSAPLAGHGKAATRSPHPFQNLTTRQLWGWYFRRNGVRLVFFSALYVLLIYLFCFNGLVSFIMGVAHEATSGHSDPHAAAAVKQVQAAHAGYAHDVTDAPKPAIFARNRVFDASGRLLPSPTHPAQ